MATELCTLEQLRDHALANPDKEYDLGSCSSCLAAELTGRRMFDSWYFGVPGQAFSRDDNATVPRLFGDMCHAASKPTVFTGAALAKAIDRLIRGDHPVQVAHDLL